MVKMVCLECRKVFDENELHEISYREYSGGRDWKESVSPCCHSRFNEID